MKAFFQEQFGRPATVIARAPGRLEFIGNHLDYNGGPVLGAAIDRGVHVAIAPRTDKVIRLISQSQKNLVELNLDQVQPVQGTDGWVNYPLGMLKVLRDEGMSVSHGFDLAVTNDLPMGAGLSSSAAIELAAGYALSSLYNYSVDRKRMAELGRLAENTFVGMPCGILDQGCSAFGKKDHLVAIDCATNTFSNVPMPKGLRFWVLNTQKKHALIDSLYATRHRECMEAFAVLRSKKPSLRDLASADSDLLLSSGLDGDLLKRARHVVEETARVRDTHAALAAKDVVRVGQNLTASHASSRDLFGNSCDELDFLVKHAVGCPGVLGARLTGGGFGGACMALCDSLFGEKEAHGLADAYARKFGHRPTIFTAATGDGAAVVS
jgi:galactokinase